MKRSLRTPAQLWPGGFEAFIDDLKKAGFEPELPEGSRSTQRDPEFWNLLRDPHGSDHPSPGPECFCYLGAGGKLANPSAWGLVLLDQSSELSPAKDKFRGLRVRNADAAMDFCVRRLAVPEWAGASEPVPNGVVAESGVVIGPDCQIGEGTILEAGVRLGARVKIGRNCRVGAHSRIGDDCELGDNCLLTAQVSIGGQGFGFVGYPNEKRRRPRLHVGRVVVGDDVRIGAQVSIDRGVFEDTVIGSASALDNIVQVGHNCRVGQGAVFCSFVGLSGSTSVGDNVTIAGMVGTKGHVRIGNNAIIAAQSGVSRDIRDGETVKGYPPRPLPQALEIQALTAKLPDIYKRLKQLEALSKDSSKDR